MATLLKKVIAITGGASGIGLATAKLAASRGAILSLADINYDALKAAKHSIEAVSQSKVLITQLDVTRSKDVDTWINNTASVLGRLDGAANLAGVIGKYSGVKRLVEIDDEYWDQVLRINLTGLMYCLRAQMRAIHPGGSIVNAASIAGLAGHDKYSPYVTSKHGVLGLSRCAAREGADRKIRVNIISP